MPSPKSRRKDSTVSAQHAASEAVPSMELANHFLVAMPGMLDPVFGGTVVYICEHNDNGALGLIINKPTDMTLNVLLERLDLKLEIQPARADAPVPGPTAVLFGGPVQVERGFVLHAPHGNYSSTMQVTEQVVLTTSRDVLEAAAAGSGPTRMTVTLGCAGWSAGQLEEEVARNGWLTVPADPAIIFELPLPERFTAALKLLGIDPHMLSGQAGHA
jgi:putative transcriptional regulator